MIKRYDCEWDLEHDDIVFDECIDGTWCKHKDVHELEQKLVELLEWIKIFHKDCHDAMLNELPCDEVCSDIYSVIEDRIKSGQ